jgi:glycosyltransferase involved in cell wall biosynthesis
VRRVLLISNKVFHYRVSNYNYFARRFRELGWEFCCRASELQKNNPYPPEFDFQVVPFGFSAYKREVERLLPDVVILFIHLKDLFVWPLIHWLKLKGIPVVYWNKGINLEVKNPGLRNQLFYYVHSRCDALILYSKKHVTDIQPKNRHKVFIAANTINLDALPNVVESREAIKREFGIPFAKFVLFVGRMRPVKKVDHLIAAFNEITDPGIGCVIVGDAMGQDLPGMSKRGNVLHLGEIFDPKNERVSKLFKAADLFCIPGDVGLGLNEAFHWGLPVVTEDGLQPPEIHYMTHDRNGFIVPEGDIASLRERILLLLRDDVLRAKFSASAREDIAREASIERMFTGFRDCVIALTDPASSLCARRFRAGSRSA